MKRSAEIQASINEAREKIESIVATCEKDERDLNKSEQEYVDQWLGSGSKPGKIDELTAEASRAVRIEKETSERIRANLGPKLDAQLREVGIVPTNSKTFRDASGRAIRSFSGNQPMGTPGNGHLIGELVSAVVTGKKSWHSDAVLNAMMTTSNPAGGYLVPTELWGSFVDLARSKTVMIAAGASVIEMPGAEVHIVGIQSDPTFEVKSEGAAFSGSAVAFKQIKLESKTIGNTIRMSRELFEDGVNVADIVSQVLARSFASALDSLALTGTGAGNSLPGLTTHASISNTGTTAIGAIEWADVHNAAIEIRKRNHEPTAAVLNPESYGDLMKSFGQDIWTPSPPSLAGVQMLHTSAMPLAFGLVGDFSTCVFGVRRSASIEISIDGDDFETHSVSMKLVWRGDFGLLDSNAMHRLEGITS